MNVKEDKVEEKKKSGEKWKVKLSDSVSPEESEL